MQWRKRYNYVRPVRPKALSLKADEAEQISKKLKVGIDCSPVLKALGVQVRLLRSRFYLEWRWDPLHETREVSTYGRMTPLQTQPGELLLEAPYGRDQWSRIGKGSPGQLI